MSLSGIIVLAFFLVNLVMAQPCDWVQLAPTQPAPLRYQLYQIKPDVDRPESVALACQEIVVTTPYGKRCYSLQKMGEALKNENKDISQFLPAAECYAAHAAGVQQCVESAGKVITPKVWTNIRPVNVLPRLVYCCAQERYFYGTQ